MHGDPAFISIGAGFGIECDRNIAGSNIWYNIKKYPHAGNCSGYF
jgi:hypothetical protein